MRYFVLLILASGILPVAHASFKSDLEAIVNREVNLYDSTGHPKAHGIKLKIRYPSSWLAEEGDRPLIVQKFRSEGGKGLGHFTLTISKPIPADDGEIDPEVVWNRDFIVSTIPPAAKWIEYEKTSLDGEPVGMVIYTLQQDNAGIIMTTRVVSFLLIRNRCLVSLNGNLAKMPSQSEDSFELQAAVAKSLYQAIAASLIILEKRTN